MNLALIYISLLTLFSVTFYSKNINRQFYEVLIGLIVALNLVAVSSTVLYFEPGDYSVYLKVFEGCAISADKCILVSPFEPFFTFLILLLNRFFSPTGFQLWILIAIINQIIIVTALHTIGNEYCISKSKVISMFAILSIYSFSNFNTLAIRYSLSFSVFMLGIAFLKQSRSPFNTTNLIALSCFILSFFTHYQSLFLMIFPFLLMVPRLPILNKILPDLGSRIPKISFRIKKKSLNLLMLVSILGLSIYFASSYLLIFFGKSYYLSNYMPGSLGIRPFVETLLCINLIVPTLLKKAKHQNLSVYRFAITSLYFLLFSMILSYISLYLFSIDGFSRQLQSAFLILLISHFTVYKSRDSIYKASFWSFLVYTILITLYTLITNESFMRAI